MDSAPWLRNVAVSSSRPLVPSGATTEPLRSIRSSTPWMAERGTSGSALANRATFTISPSDRPATFWTVRPMMIASSWPRVVSSAVLAPVRVIRMFVATVVPWAKIVVSPSSDSVSSPSRPAASATAPSTPSSKSGGVEGDLARTTVPSLSTTTQSLKVPPLSTATT
jgi:hypothetical protein